MSAMKTVAEPEAPKHAPPVALHDNVNQDISMDDSDKRLSQSEMKDQAIKHLVDLIHSPAVSEEHAKVLFDRYDTRSQGVWAPRDVRIFLMDLQEAFGQPRVVPDEALSDVLKELQLNIDAPGGVTWVEFKSYLIFLQQSPLQTMHETVQKTTNPELLKSAVIITNLPPQAYREQLAALVSGAGTVAHTWIVDESGLQAMVLFTEQKSVAEAVKLSGTDFQGHKIVVTAFEGQDFPTLVFTRKPNVIASALAKVYVTAKSLDERTKVTATIKQGVEKANTHINAFVEEHKLKEKLHDAAQHTQAAAKQVDDKLKITQTLSEVNEKYQLGAKAQKAKEEAAKVSAQVLANPHVQAVGSFFGALASKVQQSVSEFADDTAAAVVEEQRKAQHQQTLASPAPSPSPAVPSPSPASEEQPDAMEVQAVNSTN